jgi:hypothetical protein
MGEVMAKYYASVVFSTQDFDAANDEEAEEKINQLIDQLGAVDTELSWDNPEWIIFEEAD